MVASMKMGAFWDPLMVEAVHTSGTSIYSDTTRRAISQKALVIHSDTLADFILE
jgi:hypothetical protein